MSQDASEIHGEEGEILLGSIEELEEFALQFLHLTSSSL